MLLGKYSHNQATIIVNRVILFHKKKLKTFSLRPCMRLGKGFYDGLSKVQIKLIFDVFFAAATLPWSCWNAFLGLVAVQRAVKNNCCDCFSFFGQSRISLSTGFSKIKIYTQIWVIMGGLETTWYQKVYLRGPLYNWERSLFLHLHERWACVPGVTHQPDIAVTKKNTGRLDERKSQGQNAWS